MFPVVQSGAAEVPVVHAEAQRTDQPELGPDGHASPPDVAGVVGDFRLVEDDVQQRTGGFGGLGGDIHFGDHSGLFVLPLPANVAGTLRVPWLAYRHTECAC